MENAPPKPSRSPRSRRPGNEQLLAEIAAFCQRIGMAESTFGRRVVNDGKLVSRLRFGGRVTTIRSTASRRSWPARSLSVARNPGFASIWRPWRSDHDDEPGRRLPDRTNGQFADARGGRMAHDKSGATGETDVETRFRFYDNRQKYLLFVSTCTEKWVVAQRIETRAR